LRSRSQKGGRTVRRFLAILVAAGVLLGLSAPASAITWGKYDGDNHPHVVTMLFTQNGDGYFSCTGTLLSRTLVLTAGHCTGWIDESGQLQPNDVTYVTNAPDINVLIEETRDDYDSTLEWLKAEWVEGQAIPHPSYDEFAAFPDTYDIGLVQLDAPGIDTGGLYGTVPTEVGQFDYLGTAKGSPSQRMVEVVGYGLVGRIPAFADDEVWQRQVAYSTVINTGRSATAGEQNFIFTNNPGRGTGVGGTCSGDSGGPAFWIDPATGEPTNLIVAVNSYAIAPNCNGTDYQFRTDSAAAQDFLSDYLS
jgi:hypothetical protein